MISSPAQSSGGELVVVVARASSHIMVEAVCRVLDWSWLDWSYHWLWADQHQHFIISSDHRYWTLTTELNYTICTQLSEQAINRETYKLHLHWKIFQVIIDYYFYKNISRLKIFDVLIGLHSSQQSAVSLTWARDERRKHLNRQTELSPGPG